MDFKQPSLITTTILLILGVGIFYFLDLPQYDRDKAQKEKIANFIEQKRLKEEHTKKIAQIGINLKNLDWEEKKKKIEPNFVSSPFFIPKMEVFFKDLVARSNMVLVSVTFQSSGSATVDAAPAATPAPTTGVTTETAGAKNANVNPVGDESLATPRNQSGVIGIKGPVKKNTFNLSASGKYEDMKNLLSIFEKQAYLISVRSVSFSEGKGNQFNFTIVGDIYSY
ncbi:MAG: hypothetical protein PHW52_00235 [Candidatus Pacebacteria bacterium]|nr:hypothetical protein [Candidatus Paceibacterota bacterium]